LAEGFDGRLLEFAVNPSADEKIVWLLFLLSMRTSRRPYHVTIDYQH